MIPCRELSEKAIPFDPKEAYGKWHCGIFADGGHQQTCLTEPKFTKNEFEIDADYYKNLTRKIDIFRNEIKAKKVVHLTLIIFNGLVQNKYSSIVVNEIAKNDPL